MDRNANREYLMKIARTKMPFGKHAGMYLVDLPETYVLWLRNQGFPDGELGYMLGTIYEIKVNGLEYLFKPLKANVSTND